MMKQWPKWVRKDGSVVACTEKVKVMAENFDEISQVMQDALEDGLLMEVSEDQMRQTLHAMVDQLVNPYPEVSS
jgi:DNA-binding transcriptional regulator YhcF (GntR family)